MNYKIIYYFLVWTFAYILLVEYFVPPNFTFSQHPNQGNFVKAEKLLFGDNVNIKRVIVGSSLSNYINLKKTNKFYNCAIGGESALEGLDIVLNSNCKPDIVFVEINLLYKPYNANFKNLAMPYLLNTPREFVAAFRESKQPIGIFGRLLSHLNVFEIGISGVNDCLLPIFTINNSSSGLSVIDFLDVQSKNYSIRPDMNFLNHQILLLSNRVKTLKKRGAKIVFFEMPINYKIANSPKASSIREFILNHFKGYPFLQTPKGVNYTTKDGLHLTTVEAIQYSEYFENEIKPYLN